MTGQFLLTPELLRSALWLPEGTVILDVHMTDDERYVAVTVQHDSIRSPELEPRFRREPNGDVHFVSWGEK